MSLHFFKAYLSFFFPRKVTFPAVKQLHTFTPQRFSLSLPTFSNDSDQSASSNILATLNTESNRLSTFIQCKQDHLMSLLFLFRLNLLREYTFGNPWCHEKHKQKQIWLHLMHLAAKRRKTEQKPERKSTVDDTKFWLLPTLLWISSVLPHPNLPLWHCSVVLPTNNLEVAGGFARSSPDRGPLNG